MLKFGNDDTKIGNVSVKGNIGVRWVTTDVSSTGGAQFPLYVAPVRTASRPERRIRTVSRRRTTSRFMNQGSYTASRRCGAHQLAAEPEPALRSHRRAVRPLRGVARAVARRTWACTSSTTRSRVDTGAAPPVPSRTPSRVTARRAPVACTPRYTADTGNPTLKPTTADQLDLTYEWYFSNTGSFTAALFYKKFNDYILKASYDAGLHQQRRDAHGQRDAARSNADGAKRDGRRSRVPDVLRPSAGTVEWPGCPGQLHVRRQQGRARTRA